MIRLSCFAGRNVAVFGLGGSGRASARALAEGGAKVFAWDDSESSREVAFAEGLNIVDLRDADWREFQSLLLAPGVPLTHPKPHWTVERAREAGCEIIGDIELFCLQRAADCPNAPMIAITGTNGKSTTTALISHLLRAVGCDVQMGGNIGKAILTLEPPSESRVHVIEVSSYQIDLAPSLNPTVGVLLNLSPDHLDRHGSMENYADVKVRLIAGSDKKVIGLDDSWTRAVAMRFDGSEDVYPFASGKGSGVIPRLYAMEKSLFLHRRDGAVGSSEEIANLDGASALRGGHNVQNALAALSAIKALNDCSLPGLGDLWCSATLQDALMSFPGLAHRLEFVGETDGVVFVNDSKATNVRSAQTALAAFDTGVHWIGGGLAKDGGIDDLLRAFDCVDRAYLIGDAAEAFSLAIGGRVPVTMCGTLEAAVKVASAEASKAHEKGDRRRVVLLSPACASFDQFSNFEERGNAFREFVSAVPGARMKERAQ